MQLSLYMNICETPVLCHLHWINASYACMDSTLVCVITIVVPAIPGNSVHDRQKYEYNACPSPISESVLYPSMTHALGHALGEGRDLWLSPRLEFIFGVFLAMVGVGDCEQRSDKLLLKAVRLSKQQATQRMHMRPMHPWV